MKIYQREDGVMCEAQKFNGYVEDGADKVFEIVALLHVDGCVAHWVAEESTDVWEEDPETGDPFEIIIPEHIKTVNDQLKVGDYIVRRDGDIYVMDGSTFEAVWSEMNFGILNG